MKKILLVIMLFLSSYGFAMEAMRDKLLTQWHGKNNKIVKEDSFLKIHLTCCCLLSSCHGSAGFYSEKNIRCVRTYPYPMNVYEKNIYDDFFRNYPFN